MTIVGGLGTADAKATCLAAPDRLPMSFADLRAQCDYVAGFFARLGLQRGDCVAICLRNGPDLASAVLAVAESAAAAPLNPAYRTSEMEFYLRDLEARAMVVEDGGDCPAAVEAARTSNVSLIGLATEPGGIAGRFTLKADGFSVLAPVARPAHDPATALLLHTSGTTARPKLVPLTRHSLGLSAQNIARTLALGPDDVCLNIMPLFHVHGLIAAVLASLRAGGSVWCAPGFNAHRALRWFEESRPTWCTAVPTMYQAMLARVPANGGRVRSRRLRFVRSSSAPMPVSVGMQIEAAFGVPLITAYGMTEAAHQIASNPLPPAIRKAGTVGRPSGVEITVQDECGATLPPGACGEILLRGTTVMAAYERPAEANASAFRDGWFRTGDQGHVDGEGYVTLTGRLKEMINCGGEKVSPYEVEDVLLQHDAVCQAVSFAVPHKSLGEEVGAAVVLRSGKDVTPAELRGFAADRLVKFKVPRHLLVLPELPKGATGKLVRIGLASVLGLDRKV